MDESSPHAMIPAPADPLPVGPVPPRSLTTKKNMQQQQQPNRLQNSVRLLLKQASEFQQQHQQKKLIVMALNTNTTKKSNSFDPIMTQITNTVANTTGSDTCGNLNSVISSSNTAVQADTVPPDVSVVAVVDDTQNQPVLLKQAGAALQQQIRGLRRRVKSVRSLQQQSQNIGADNVVEGSSSQNSESQHSYTDVLMTSSTSSRGQIAIVSPHFDDMSDSLDVSKLTPKKISPISKNTFKIDIQEQHRSSSSSSSSSAIISHPDSLYDAICIWYDACYDLLTGPDMVRLLYSTGYVYYYGIQFGIQTMALPITVPVHIGYTIGDIFVRTTLSILPAANSTSRQNVPTFSQHQSSGQVSEEEDVHSDQQHHDGGLFGEILSIPGTILHITGKVVLAIVAPVLGGGGANDDLQKQQRQKQSTGVSSSPEEKEKAVFYAKTPSRYPTTNNGHADYLERLRLDFSVKDVDPMPRRKLFSSVKDEADKSLEYKNVAIVTPVMEQSEFLLRVNDWGVTRPTDDCDLYYIDISPTAMNDKNDNHRELVTIALDRFVQGAILLLSSHPFCQIVVDDSVGGGIESTLAQQDLMAHSIQWHPEGSTKRLLRERSQATSPTAHDQSNPFRDDILIWSGRFQHEVQNGYGRKHGFFLARGCIQMSPDNFVKLLWDNTRTSEYNNFCLGRFTLHGLTCSSTRDDDQSFLDGTSKTASKVIQSEMRVPFAGITVKAVCLMHVRPLTTNDGYIICSRSLDVGPSGIQTATSILQQLRCNNGSSTITPAKNEILWGVNIIRSMPNHPNGTELTSLSQVGSAVPSFLAQKIGLMGIGDFFKNVRQVAERNINN